MSRYQHEELLTDSWHHFVSNISVICKWKDVVLSTKVQRSSNYNQCVRCFKPEREVYKTISSLKKNPWNRHFSLGLFLAHTRTKQTPECLSCAGETAAIDNGILSVLKAR